jgi:hypothetical protein
MQRRRDNHRLHQLPEITGCSRHDGERPLPSAGTMQIVGFFESKSDKNKLMKLPLLVTMMMFLIIITGSFCLLRILFLMRISF